ncbi:enoyl-CoA hydratase-related protein [Candidatus Accumulibacter vicinus]|uniref:Putative enoyl-CoA hydratase echA8 n=1 Tax=Candidatus Accumulibacter vicinus TaxID=2954382 RepID=A0A084Y1J0_9PROT|nr:enoyl-CoA hydratase-related protein [Candidatus Accumulibacter vicinus]KFB68584.1 MAG: putative enoyl-CoA hydratase echA8 [Candidatus Accumulibacter vicinus]
MSSNSVVTYEKRNQVAYLTLNRPDALNALSLEVLTRLSGLLEEIRKDDAIRAVIITGAGSKAFSAGADIKYLSQSTPMKVREFSQLAVTVTNQIENLGKVVVAALNGYTFGGGLEIAEACMIRVTVRSGRLGHPEVSIGAVAGFGGTTRLARLVGRGRAAEMLLRGRNVTADEALQIGLVQFVVDDDRLMAETEAIVDDILAKSPSAVQLTWEALHRGLNMTLEESALLGADFFGLVASTEDFRIGTQAFVNKARKNGRSNTTSASVSGSEL